MHHFVYQPSEKPWIKGGQRTIEKSYFTIHSYYARNFDRYLPSGAVAQPGVGKYTSNSGSDFDLQTRHSRKCIRAGIRRFGWFGKGFCQIIKIVLSRLLERFRI